jgi:2-amino-4-hydroxy-6-hydroxymethyldihydropteridine diphosphokinase
VSNDLMAAATLAFVGLGSNIGDRLLMLQEAERRLVALGTVEKRSSVYETAPVGPPQPDYLNAVVALRTSSSPLDLLEGLLRVERSLGRERRERWGPRTIDLDLLAMEGVTLDLPTLTLPHPEIRHRAFVLSPWRELAPDFEVPGQGTVRSLWESLPESERLQVRPLAAGWLAPA